MGQPAARLMDMHMCPAFSGPVPHGGGPIVVTNAYTTLIGGMPAATACSMATCVGGPDVIMPPCAANVLIGGIPAARMGDMTVHGGTVVLGCFNVLIGTVPNPVEVATTLASALGAGCGGPPDT